MSEILLNRKIIVRLGRLLNMRYRPAEVSAELGITVETIYRSWMPAGIPFEKDSSGHIWIVGSQLAEWIRLVTGERKNVMHLSMARDQAYCLKCRAVTTILNPRSKPLHTTTVHLSGKCGKCGSRIYRIATKLTDGVKIEGAKNDQP